MRVRRRSAPILLFLVSCAKPDDVTPPVTTLPTETTGELPSVPLEDTGTWVGMDTGGTVTNLEPEATLLVIQEGFWQLGPAGGPYDTLSGTLQVNEWPDGEIDTGTDTAAVTDTAEPPLCDVLFSFAGTVLDQHSCADCDVVFRVEWTLVEGDAAPCRDPDLPTSKSVWIMGYAPSSQTIKFNYYGSGVWVDWYTTEQVGADTLRVTYETTKGVAVEDDN